MSRDAQEFYELSTGEVVDTCPKCGCYPPDQAEDCDGCECHERAWDAAEDEADSLEDWR